MDRLWFLTYHTYASWLPGAGAGFVSAIREGEQRVIHNEHGTDCDADLEGLERYTRAHLKGEPILLTREQADVVLSQLEETARHRQWTQLGVSISPTHVHQLVGVPGDPDPEKLLGDFKAWASRALNQRWGKPRNGTWWTKNGSTRKRKGEESVLATLDYIARQQGAWIIWIAPQWRERL